MVALPSSSHTCEFKFELRQDAVQDFPLFGSSSADNGHWGVSSPMAAMVGQPS